MPKAKTPSPIFIAEGEYRGFPTLSIANKEDDLFTKFAFNAGPRKCRLVRDPRAVKELDAFISKHSGAKANGVGGKKPAYKVIKR